MMSGSLLILIPKKLCHGLSLGEEGWNGWRINALCRARIRSIWQESGKLNHTKGQSRLSS